MVYIAKALGHFEEVICVVRYLKRLYWNYATWKRTTWRRWATWRRLASVPVPAPVPVLYPRWLQNPLRRLGSPRR